MTLLFICRRRSCLTENTQTKLHELLRGSIYFNWYRREDRSALQCAVVRTRELVEPAIRAISPRPPYFSLSVTHRPLLLLQAPGEPHRRERNIAALQVITELWFLCLSLMPQEFAILGNGTITKGPIYFSAQMQYKMVLPLNMRMFTEGEGGCIFLRSHTVRKCKMRQLTLHAEKAIRGFRN
jgi:hypothetical protein